MSTTSSESQSIESCQSSTVALGITNLKTNTKQDIQPKPNRPQKQLDVAPSPSGEWQPSLERQNRVTSGLDWPTITWLAVLHGGALAAPFTFSWSGLGLLLFLHWFTGGIGICLGFHRMLTHASFKTYRPIRYLIALIGGLAGEGSAIDWVSNHRKHHACSDQEGDPHSPNDGGWWSHAHWLVFLGRDKDKNHTAFVNRWAPDLAKDPGMRLVAQLFLPMHFLFGVALFGLGYWFGGTYLGWSWLVWGLFLRLITVLHSTWFVNSASHIWGYRNYETTDKSRNLWWVGLIAYGEGWHNNHHAYPRMANHGHRWWEFDMTYRFIQMMKVCGIAWDVVNYKSRSERTSS